MAGAFSMTAAVPLALRLARDFRLAAAERGHAGGRELRLVLEQARGDLAAVRNELAADTLRIAGTRVLPAAPHVVRALRGGRRGPHGKTENGGSEAKSQRSVHLHLETFSLAVNDSARPGGPG